MELSFSGQIKEELAKHWSEARHCQIAEIAAIIIMCGQVTIDSRERYAIKVKTENLSVARKYFTLLEKTFNINTETFVSRNLSRETISYTVAIKKHEDSIKVLQATKLIDASGDIVEEFSMVKNLIILHSCCKRAFLRGAFLAAGSISNPEKSYHIEIVCAVGKKAEQIKAIIEENRLEAVISMPSGVFKPYAGVSTGILIFTKTGHGGTDKVWFYDMTADGYSLDDKRTTIADNDIPDIIARFKNLDAEQTRERTDKSFFVPKQEIVDNDYDLSINKYKKTEYTPVEYPSTTELMTDLYELQIKISEGMDELGSLLGL